MRLKKFRPTLPAAGNRNAKAKKPAPKATTPAAPATIKVPTPVATPTEEAPSPPPQALPESAATPSLLTPLPKDVTPSLPSPPPVAAGPLSPPPKAPEPATAAASTPDPAPAPSTTPAAARSPVKTTGRFFGNSGTSGGGGGRVRHVSYSSDGGGDSSSASGRHPSPTKRRLTVAGGESGSKDGLPATVFNRRKSDHKKKFSGGVPERGKMTMFDLIYYNPEEGHRMSNSSSRR